MLFSKTLTLASIYATLRILESACGLKAVIFPTSHLYRKQLCGVLFLVRPNSINLGYIFRPYTECLKIFYSITKTLNKPNPYVNYKLLLRNVSQRVVSFYQKKFCICFFWTTAMDRDWVTAYFLLKHPLYIHRQIFLFCLQEVSRFGFESRLFRLEFLVYSSCIRSFFLVDIFSCLTILGSSYRSFITI